MKAVMVNNANLEITKRLAEIEPLIQTLRSLYEERDRLTLQLVDVVGLGVEVTEGDLVFSVVDNFAEKNTVFRPAGVKRFELSVDSIAARKIKAERKEKKK